MLAGTSNTKRLVLVRLIIFFLALVTLTGRYPTFTGVAGTYRLALVRSNEMNKTQLKNESHNKETKYGK